MNLEKLTNIICLILFGVILGYTWCLHHQNLSRSGSPIERPLEGIKLSRTVTPLEIMEIKLITDHLKKDK